MKTCFSILLGMLCLFSVIESCQNKPSSGNKADIHSTTAGGRLIQKYCSSCHLPVYPETLDSAVWIGRVLPAMAPKLGIKVWQGHHYFVPPHATHPPQISFSDWMKIIRYFKKTAPKKLKPVKNSTSLQTGLNLFKPILPQWKDTTQLATTTLITIDSITHAIYTGDGYNKLFEWNQNLESTLIKYLPSPPVNMLIENDSNNIPHGMLTCIGILKAVDVDNGTMVNLNLKDTTSAAPLFPGEYFYRPVQIAKADFNKDGLEDWIVCSFGHDKGGLFLLQQMPNHHFKRKLIDGTPGAEEVVTGDYNHDGWPDLMVLFAQAREGIWLFTNNKKGGFSSKNLLQFPPVYGSTSFQIKDFNHDGRPDILYTCGDNADYSPILKPFHGVYIFLNQGNFHYKKAFFYHINGCTKAIAADFDQDGDPDIATIAFFADFKHNPAESFIYFKQDKPMHFIPYSLPIHKYGRWICMSVGDYDQDGDPDIALGNYSRGFRMQDSLKTDWNTHLPMIVLKNRSHQ